MPSWIIILVVIGGIVIIPMLLKQGLKAIFTLLIVAGIGAFIGWALDWVFGTYPTITYIGIGIAVIGLVGSSLEIMGNQE